MDTVVPKWQLLHPSVEGVGKVSLGKGTIDPPGPSWVMGQGHDWVQVSIDLHHGIGSGKGAKIWQPLLLPNMPPSLT